MFHVSGIRYQEGRCREQPPLLPAIEQSVPQRTDLIKREGIDFDSPGRCRPGYRGPV